MSRGADNVDDGIVGRTRRDRKHRFDAVALAGLLVTGLLHGGAIGLLIHMRRAAAAQAPADVGNYVVARLVRLGKKRNPKKLPNKVVPPAPTRKPEAVSYDAKATDAPIPKKKKDEPDREAVAADRMRHSLEKAALFEKARREIEAEGDPHGVVGGTALEGSSGDAYITRIADIWNRTWSLPAIIPPDEARHLQVLMVLKIDRYGNIQTPITFDQASGNEYFDSSIKVAWARIGRLPLPPPDRLASILAHGLALKLTWKGLR